MKREVMRMALDLGHELIIDNFAGGGTSTGLEEGFGRPADYVIREIPNPDLLFKDGRQVDGSPLDLPRVPLTKSSQVRMCGNSVCPPMARALIEANFGHEREIARVA